MLTILTDLYKLAAKNKKKKIIVAAAHDRNVLEAVSFAKHSNLIDAILVGKAKEIEKLASENHFDISNIEIINEEEETKAAEISVKLIYEKKGDILMKGKLNTATLIKTVLKKEYGLITSKRLSHLAIFELKNYHKLLAMTDGAINIAPNVQKKADIINNAVDYLMKLGIKNPKVAALAGVEFLNPQMPATIDAVKLVEMNKKGEIKNCIVDGPLAFDNAISKESALHKGITSEVAGDADLLLVSEIEVGNVLYKALMYMADAKCAGIVVGASVPIVLTSRSDSKGTKLNSIALAAAIK